MRGAAVRGIERRGDRRALGEDFAAPFDQRHLLRLAHKAQSRLATARGDALGVADDGSDFLRRVGRAFAEQAVQQEHVEKTHRARGDADCAKGIEVHQAHLDVLDAAVAQGVQWPFSGADHAFGPDGPVELVLDLQQARGELAVVVAVADADRLVGGIGLGERVLERGGVALEAVVAHRERGLRVALVAQPPHAQRGRVGQVERVLAQPLELVRAVVDEARAHRGRGAEKVEQQPGMAPEIADQREVRFIGSGSGSEKL